MEIRSLTYFLDLTFPLDAAEWRRIARFAKDARAAFTSGGYQVQSVRLATQPFPQLLASSEALTLAGLAAEVEAAALDAGMDYVSLGPAPGTLGEFGWLAAEGIPEAIAATEAAFFGMDIASAERGIDFPGLKVAAGVIQQVSHVAADGFGNLRLAALANCKPWSPFFPAAYHGGGAPRFAVATESADLAVRAFSEASSPADAEGRLASLVQQEAEQMTAIAHRAARELDIGFAGIDFSLAPFPETGRSVGHAIETLTGGKFGERGTLFAARSITRAVQRAQFPKTGFCGLMLPVLEDAVLAARSEDGTYTLDSLLLYSAVCGTGLDTIPLPGSVTREELASILVDLAALAVQLDKPLTARLMPIPGKEANDRTDFQFDYFANASILDVHGAAERFWR